MVPAYKILCKEAGVLLCIFCMLAQFSVAHPNRRTTSFDQPFQFQCPAHQYVSHIKSLNDNHKEDRAWDFYCKNVPVTSQEELTAETCHWSEYANDFDNPLVFECHENAYLSGVSSYHDNHREDRRFKFYCCHTPGYHMQDCKFTGWVNSYDGPMDYSVSDTRVLRGAVSFHDNHKEDRIWEFEECHLALT